MGMGKKLAIICLIIIACLRIDNKANPIVPYFFSELKFTDNSWELELTDQFYILDGWYLTTRRDTVQLKSGLISNNGFFVITPNDLKNDLFINPTGDTLKLLNDDKYTYDMLSFGVGGFVSAPRMGQSICVLYDNSFFTYYLDNSPTIGFPNDNNGATGIVEGFVFDANYKSVGGAEVIYFQYGTLTSEVITHNNGYFCFIDFAKFADLYIKNDSYSQHFFTFQIYPDSTITFDTLKLDIAVDVSEKQNLPDSYILTQNYPNPFNPTTTINYSIPAETTRRVVSTTLKVYDILGREVITLVNEQKSPGNYEVTFDGSKLSSGVYLYRLQSGSFSQTKKLVLKK